LVAGVGRGSSKRDYDALGVSFEDRCQLFDEAAVMILRALLRDERPPERARHFAPPSASVAPAPRRAGGLPLQRETSRDR
jgi:alkanesulfonate monooxygenase SsuD/methylene tetrahydromethanopterin reductase-like flavin-dependent oxidoreductase (luciferase family)